MLSGLVGVQDSPPAMRLFRTFLKSGVWPKKMFVRDLMSRPAVTVLNGTTVDDAIKVLLREAAPEIYVIDDAGRFMGAYPTTNCSKSN